MFLLYGSFSVKTNVKFRFLFSCGNIVIFFLIHPHSGFTAEIETEELVVFFVSGSVAKQIIFFLEVNDIRTRLQN